MPKARANPAVLELLKEDGELDAILSGRGLSFERASGPPPTPPGPPLEVEPPDWIWQPSAGVTADPPGTPADGLGGEALAELRARDHSDDDDEPLRFGAVVTNEPLARPTFPAPDWREEERLRRQAEAPAEAVEEEPTNHPPPRRLPT